MEIRLPEDAVNKILSNEVLTSEQIWSILSDALPEKDRIFAAFSTASGMYVWTLPGTDWTPVSSTDAVTEEMARDVLRIKRRSVSWALSGWPDLRMEALFTIPSDDYFFVRTGVDGQVRIMLAAWDYVLLQKQEAMEGKVKGDRPETRQDVILMFIEADEPVSGYRLKLQQADGNWTEKETDDAGRFAMPGLEIGKQFQIRSLDGGRDYSFTVIEGRSLIVHDLTGPLKVELEVTRDGVPAAGLPARIVYDSREFDAVTGADGVAHLSFPYRRNAEVTARVEGETATAPAAYPLTRLSIGLFMKTATVVVEYYRGDAPVSEQLVLVRVSGMEDIVLRTDLSGRATCTVPFRKKSYVVAHSGGFVDKKYLREETFFRFVAAVPVEPPKPKPMPKPKPKSSEIVDGAGNSEGDDYDLVKDGEMEGYRVVILNIGSMYLSETIAVLEKKGFSVLTYSFSTGSGFLRPDDKDVRPCDFRELDEVLRDEKTQLWVIADSSRVLGRREVKVICHYFELGRGLYLWSDNDPFFADTNVIQDKLFGCRMAGSYEGDQVLSIQETENAPGIIGDHPIATGIRAFLEGSSVSHVEGMTRLKPLAYNSNSEILMAYYDQDGKRALIDGGYTRLWFSWHIASEGTSRLIANSACWLAGRG